MRRRRTVPWWQVFTDRGWIILISIGVVVYALVRLGIWLVR